MREADKAGRAVQVEKEFSAAVFIWAACRCGGDLDLGGSPQVLNARGVTLAAPSSPAGVRSNLPDLCPSVLAQHFHSLIWEFLKMFCTEPDFVRGPANKENPT